MNPEQQPVPLEAQPVQPPQMVQPVAPDTQSFQDAPKVQYVVMQKSLEGLGGWLAFFLSVFGLNAIYYVSSTFKEPVGIHTVTDPLLSLAYITCVVLIAMRKRIALWAIYGTLTLSFLVGVITTLTNEDTSEAAVVVGTIVGSIIIHGLMALYFYSSKRVKATLVA